MKQLKNYGIQLLYLIGGIILCSLLLSVFNYFNILKESTSHVVIFLLIIIISLLSGLSCGKKAEKKGFLEGLKIGGIFVLTLTLLNLIFFASSFNIHRICYYIIILISTTVGSMIGINKKKNN